MAAADPVIIEVKNEELDEAICCCICTDVYTEPKLLPCLHTFCMKCIQDTGIITNINPGDEMPCPICRRPFRIPKEGFNGLPNNSYIEQLIQVENILDKSALSREVCDACSEENEEETSEQIPVADAYCLECKQKLCRECCMHHRKVKLTKNHKLVPIKELQKGVMSNLVSQVCEHHEQKDLDVHCVKCKVVVCAICFIDDHKNHDGSHVSKYVTRYRQELEINAESMNECSSQAQRKRGELMMMKQDIQQKVGSLESDVVNRTYAIKQLADEHAHSILQDINVLQRNKLKEIEVAISEVDAYVSVLDSLKTSCQTVITQGSPSHICHSVSKLSGRAAELQRQRQPMVEQEIRPIAISFKTSEIEEFLKSEGGNLIGEIKDECNTNPKESSKRTQTAINIKTLEANVEELKQDLNSEKVTNEALQAEIEDLQKKLESEKKSNEILQADLDQLNEIIVTERKSAKEAGLREKMKAAELRYKSDPVLVQRIGRRATKEENEGVRGLAILDNEIFVVSSKSSEIEVYDLKKLGFSRRMNLIELCEPQDMVSCSRKKCLYIIDYKGVGESKEILRVDPNGEVINNWSTGDDCGFSLSVTDESNVILTVSYRNKLNEYSPEGQLIREINLSSAAGIRFPLYAIKIANCDYVVSHGHYVGKLRGMRVIDANAKLVKSFGGELGSTARNTWRPVRFAIDVNGFLLVVDQENSRVLLLDQDLQFKGEILSKERHGLGSPTAICLDETNGRLLVVDKLREDAPIAIFTFQ